MMGKLLTNLRCLIATRKTFATQRMYFSVSFTEKYLRHYIDPKLYDLPRKSEDGNTRIKARLIKGVNNRATITRGWEDFFRTTNIKEKYMPSPSNATTSACVSPCTPSEHHVQSTNLPN